MPTMEDDTCKTLLGPISLQTPTMKHGIASTPSVEVISSGTFFPTKEQVFITDSQFEVFSLVWYGAVCTTVSLLGIVTNAMNIAVFARLGFRNTMNISFLGLAVTDLCAMALYLWTTVVGINLDRMAPDFPWDTFGVFYLAGVWPQQNFVMVTVWITLYITAERCMCVILPFDVKHVITPKRTVIIIMTIYIANLFQFIPEYMLHYLAWNFDPSTNKTILGLAFRSEFLGAQGLTSIFLSSLQTVGFFLVIAFTCVLVLQLMRKSEKRHHLNLRSGLEDLDIKTMGSKTNDTKPNDTKTKDIKTKGTKTKDTKTKDTKTIKMVVLIAFVLIACFTTMVVVNIYSFFDPKFRITGQYKHLYIVLLEIAFFLEAVNSSVNMFVYYEMNSMYRATFKQLF